jgi:hypothetical protein
MTKTNGRSLRVVALTADPADVLAADPYEWGQEELELHWPAGDGGVICGSEDFVSVTFIREAFDAHERVDMACPQCAQRLLQLGGADVAEAGVPFRTDGPEVQPAGTD